MNNQLDIKRIAVFFAFAFGIAWLIGLVIYLMGGLAHSPEIVPGTDITLAYVLIAVGYMWSPALAHILTRLLTREGWQALYVRPRLRGWPYWIVAWLVPVVVTFLGAVAFFAIFPQFYDASLTLVRESLVRSGLPASSNPWTVLITRAAIMILVAPLANGLFIFGEEFGWRAYLQPKLMPLGGRKTMMLIGMIWGIWHWPMIMMGYEYGLDSPGFPWSGMLMMVWASLLFGTFLGWVTLRSRSIWPAVIGHAVMNAVGTLGLLLVQGKPNPLLGPAVNGAIGSVALAILALAILIIPNALKVSPPEG